MRFFRQPVWILLLLFVFSVIFIPNTHADNNEPDSAVVEQSIPFKTNAPDQEISITRVALSFLLLVGILVVGLYGFQRISGLKSISGPRKVSRIKIIESKGMPGKSTISLVDVDGCEYLIVKSQNNTSIIEHRAEDEVDG